MYEDISPYINIYYSLRSHIYAMHLCLIKPLTRLQWMLRHQCECLQVQQNNSWTACTAFHMQCGNFCCCQFYYYYLYIFFVVCLLLLVCFSAFYPDRIPCMIHRIRECCNEKRDRPQTAAAALAIVAGSFGLDLGLGHGHGCWENKWTFATAGKCNIFICMYVCVRGVAQQLWLCANGGNKST